MQNGHRRGRLRLAVQAFTASNNDQTCIGLTCPKYEMRNSAKEIDSVSVSVVAARALLNSGRRGPEFAAIAELIAISLVVEDSS
jgi:hypothetical protein